MHVSHFGVRSLEGALRRAGFAGVHVEVAPPELPPHSGARAAAARAARRAAWLLGRALPWGVESPLSLHLLAYARRT